MYLVYKYTDSRMVPVLFQAMFDTEKEAKEYLKKLNEKGEDGYIEFRKGGR